MDNKLGYNIIYVNEKEAAEHLKEIIAKFQYSYIVEELKKLPIEQRKFVYEELIKALEGIK